jgi:hypothetical protein
MIALNARQFNKFYWFSSALAFLLVLLRCYTVPFAHDEVATFNFYIQSGNFLPFMSHVDAMNHFLLTATSWLSFKVFGSSVLALRLPSLLSFVILSIAIFKLNNLFNGTIPKIVLTFSFLFSYHFIAFYSLARGYGMSMAFLMFALYYFFCYIRHFSFRHFWKLLFFSQLALSANVTLVFVLLITAFLVIFFQIRQKRALSQSKTALANPDRVAVSSENPVRVNQQNVVDMALVFNTRNILLLVLHFAMIGFWIKYGFYLQENGALYYGGGSNYWVVTFNH